MVKMEAILSLPSDSQVTIFAYLPLQDVLSFTCTCHAGRELLDDDKDISKSTNNDVTNVTQSIWKTLFKRDYSWAEDSSTIQYPSTSSTISMKHFYFTHVEDRVAKLVSSLSTEQQKWSDKAYNKGFCTKLSKAHEMREESTNIVRNSWVLWDTVKRMA